MISKAWFLYLIKAERNNVAYLGTVPWLGFFRVGLAASATEEFWYLRK
jgi:hypothetical protein